MKCLRINTSILLKTGTSGSLQITVVFSLYSIDNEELNVWHISKFLLYFLWWHTDVLGICQSLYCERGIYCTVEQYTMVQLRGWGRVVGRPSFLALDMISQNFKRFETVRESVKFWVKIRSLENPSKEARCCMNYSSTACLPEINLFYQGLLTG